MAIITDHALLRYLERVMGVNIRDAKRKAAKMGYVVNSDHYVLGYLQKEEGLDVDKIRKSLITPRLLTALRIGAKTVKIDGIVYVLQTGSAVTLYASESQRPKPHMRPVRKPRQFKSQMTSRKMIRTLLPSEDQDDERI